MTILTVPWYRTHSNGSKKKDGVRAETYYAKEEMRAEMRFTVSPFNWSSLSLFGFPVCFVGVVVGLFLLLVFSVTRLFHSLPMTSSYQVEGLPKS